MSNATVARKRRYEGVVNLPVDLPVAIEVLGLHERVRVGDVTAQITLPRRPAGQPAQGEGAALHAPANARTGAELSAVLDRAYNGHWGYVSSPHIAYVRSVALSVVLAPSPVMATSDELRLLGAHFDGWLEVVRLWASARMDHPLRVGGGHFTSTVHLANGSTLEGSGSVVGGGRARGGPLAFQRTGLNADQVREAFRRASKGESPPLPHVLLLSAVESGWADDRRQAVIDSVTAVEVALATDVRDRLQQHRISLAFADAAILQANGVVGLLDLFEALGGYSPVSKGKARAQLAGPRNNAAHKGLTPSAEEAKLALANARSVVHAIAPLPATPRRGL